MHHGRHPILLAATLAAALALAACASPEERAAGYLRKAEGFYAGGSYDKARLEAQNALQIEPKNGKARYLLALLEEQKQNYPAMYSNLLVAVESDPAYVDARLKLGNLQVLGRMYDDAAVQRDALLELAPEDARVRLLNARLLVQKGEREAAVAEVQRAVELDPDNTEAIAFQATVESLENLDAALARLAEAAARLEPAKARELRELRLAMLLQNNRKAEMEVELAALARDFPGEAGYEERLARFYAEEGRVDDAERLLRRVAEANPSDAKRLGYVDFLAGQRDLDQAEAALKAFIEETPDSAGLRLALGQLYEQRRQPDQAREAYGKLAADSPRSEEGILARVRLAALDLATSQPDAALKRLDAVLADVPDQPEALLLRATVRYGQQRWDEAIADLRGVLRRLPDDERGLQLLALVYVQKGDPVLAKDAYRQLLNANSASSDALKGLALLLAREGELREAEDLLRRRLKDAPDDVQAGSLLVQVLLQRQQLDAAEQEARRLVDLGSGTGLARMALGDVLSARGRHGEAAAAYRQAVELRPGDKAALNAMVRAYAEAGRAADALPVLQAEAEKGGERSVQARFLMTDVHRQTGQVQRARQLLEELARENPGDPQPWISMASTHPEDPAERVAILRRGFAAIPGNFQLGLLLGSEYGRAGDPDEALKVFEEVAAKNPDNPIAVNNLAAALLERKDDPQGVSRALELVRRLETSDDPVILDTVGWAYYRAGEPHKAVSALERVAARVPDEPLASYHLGMAYLAMGNEVGARQQLQKAVSAGREFAGIEEARAALEKL
jgi:tetratricopeptide (TPR) repeat protein